MKLEDLRPSFTVYFVSSDTEVLKAPSQVLRDAGYMCLHFDDLTSAFSEVFSNPPHFVVFDANEQKFSLRKAFRELQGQLPETHLFLLAAVEKRGSLTEYFGLGLYDILWTPPIGAKEWVKAFDRASERDYFMYMNEQLQKASGAQGMEDADVFVNMQRRLLACTSMQDCIQEFLEFGCRMLNSPGAVYLRFIPMRKLLSAAQAHGFPDAQWKGVGVDLNGDPNFRWPMLRQPQTVPHIREMCSEIFHRKEFQAVSIELAHEVSGVAIFFGQQIKPEQLQTLTFARDNLQAVAGYLELEKRMHSMSNRDDTTGVFNRAYFNERAAAEITRARRNQHPLSLVLIAVDAHGSAVSKGGPEEGDALLRLIARILEKHSRVTDVVARSASDEFALLLPDTGALGAAVKAERMRRMIEAADFEKALRHTPKITISVGISEYPSVCRDADELFLSADEALIQSDLG